MAFYSDEVIEEVRASNDIIDVISRYVTLQRKGNSYFGLCPFHREKTPSFSATPDKQIYHCFGCGLGGNVIHFIMKVENISFKEAIEFLAERANITLPVSNYDIGMSQDELKKREANKAEMYEINKIAGRFFYDNIEKSKVAQEYILKRKIDKKTVAKYGLGFALDDNGLTKLLQSKGFKEENILGTGLVGKTEKGYMYDKFKNRFMFPIFDVRKRLIAFGGRTLESSEVMKANGIPKYVNSPENLIYSKGRHLYGLNVAKSSNEKMKRLLVVEGYMDVISPHQAGITNVVASLGTALTEQQGRLIRQYANEVVLSYDSDAAGQKAMQRGIEIMQSLGVPTRILKMEGAKDPDEYVLKYGPERFEKLVDNSISPAEYKIDLLKQEYNLSDTAEKITFLTKMAEVLSKVDNNIERDVYVDKYSTELNVGREAIIAEIEKRTIRSSYKNNKWQQPKPVVLNVDETADEKAKREREKMIIYLLTLQKKEIFEKLKDVYTEADIELSSNKGLIKRFYNLYESDDTANKDIMLICETDEEKSLVSEVMMKSNTRDDIDKFAAEIIRNIEVEKLQNEKREVLKRLQADDLTEDEKGLLGNKLQEIIIKLAKK
ncbi:MAG: DNA primase [Clostridia bacterium]|nr:DNA primase [Clostridia bacterium]